MSSGPAEEWVECQTPGSNGRLYYVNKASGKVSWTKPTTGIVKRAAGQTSSSVEEKKTPSKSNVRWGALRNVVKSDSGPQDGISKSNAVIQNLLAKARRNSGIIGDGDTTQETTSGMLKLLRHPHRGENRCPPFH